jgi:hypothetical protein
LEWVLNYSYKHKTLHSVVGFLQICHFSQSIPVLACYGACELHALLNLVQVLQKGRALGQGAWGGALWSHLRVAPPVVPQLQTVQLPIVATSVPAINPQFQNAVFGLVKIAALVFTRYCLDHNRFFCTVFLTSLSVLTIAGLQL